MPSASPSAALVLAGINTHACADDRDRCVRDLAVILPREAIGAYDKAHAAVSLRYMDGKIARVLPLHEVAASIADG